MAYSQLTIQSIKKVPMLKDSDLIVINNKILEAARLGDQRGLENLIRNIKVGLDKPIHSFEYFKQERRDPRKFSLKDAIKRLQELPEQERHQIIRKIKESNKGHV